jgi:serine/threonine protein kinase
MANANNWITVAESSFPWERDALEFVRQQLPSHEPYRAWSNFEFIADDGSINEVDLLVFTPQGFFLIEIKSRPGRLCGDAGTWTWEADGKLITIDNPLIAANTKAKRLRSLLQRQKACKNKGQLPFLEALVFCSAPDLRCELQDTARYRICLRDREKDGDTPPRPGAMAAIKRRDCPGLEPYPKGTHDRPTAKILSQAMEQAGIRPSQRRRKVSDYVLDQLIGEGPGYQDWQATHVQLPNVTRRVRLYLVRAEASEEDRQTIQRAALREFQLLETLQHPGILRTHGFTEHELGPALIFEHDPLSVRLDHYLTQHKDALGVDIRLDLIRQIAEVIRFAHDKKVVHRSLCPQSILVTAPDSGRPRIKIFNWQVGYRTGSSSSGVSREVSGTSHIDRLVEDASTAYMAPETVADAGSVGEHLDVFSLGAIAYHLFSGVAPAANGLELSNKLRETKGLQISSVLNGAGENLQFLIQYSTHPEVASRIDSVADFLSYLDGVEDDLTAPEHNFVEDPTRAQKGDRLPKNFTVVKRLGQGACSVALLVERNGQEFVLKVASDPEHNQRLKDEGEILKKLRHQHIVEYCDMFDIGDRMCVLMHRAGQETLGQRLREEGRLHIDLLQRFGEDLLDVVNYLEEQGIPHRDIKPDNIGVGPVGRGDRLHLVLFDFSLSRTPAENIYAGTTGYLDPLLALRKPPRWDLHAERYAVATTLYELATGTRPKWGDGKTDPSHLDCEITIDPELFDASVRDGLREFFQTALRRDPSGRFDNAEEMLRAWRDCFEGIEQPGAFSDHENEAELHALLADATFDTQIPELGLGTRAINALDRANILTVEDLLTVPLRHLLSMPGVGNKTRREIAMAVRILRERPDQPQRKDLTAVREDLMPFEVRDAEIPFAQLDVGTLSIDLLVQRVVRPGARDGDATRQALHALLGLDPALDDPWPSQSEVARLLEVTRARVGQFIGKFLSRWVKEAAITKLRGDLAEILERSGGVMSVSEVVEAVLIARGSIQDEPQRTTLAAAVVRACVEVERIMVAPRFLIRRDHGRVLVALSQELATYASRLGDEADTLADEDPLVPPARILQQLRDITLPAGVAGLTDSRLVRLAASASQHAAVSSRQELYPRGMDAARALKLSQGALYGVSPLTVQQIHERVSSRYPEAAPLPERPALDELLRDTGFDFHSY